MALVFATSVPVAFFSPTLAKYWWLLALPANLLLRLLPGSAQGRTQEETVEPA